MVLFYKRSRPHQAFYSPIPPGGCKKVRITVSLEFSDDLARPHLSFTDDSELRRRHADGHPMRPHHRDGAVRGRDGGKVDVTGRNEAVRTVHEASI